MHAKLCFAYLGVEKIRSSYKVIEGFNTYFVSSTIINLIPVFIDSKYSDLITNSLAYCRKNKDLKLFAYVVMANHIHLLIGSDELSKTISSFKSYTAKSIIREAKKDKKDWLLNQFEFCKKKYKKTSKFQVWQEGFHPKAILDEKMLRQKMNYIHNNPVKKGLVFEADHWVYSSAKNYKYGDGIIDVDLIEI